MSVDVQRVRRMNYEPAAAACPHCGHTPQTAPQAPTGGAEIHAPVVTVPDADPVRAVVAGIVRVLMEVVDGRRAVEQLAAVASPSGCRYLRTSRSARAAARSSRLRSVHVGRPVEPVIEAAAVVVIAGRVRAVAVRLEQESTGWRCVAFRIL